MSFIHSFVRAPIIQSVFIHLLFIPLLLSHSLTMDLCLQSGMHTPEELAV